MGSEVKSEVANIHIFLKCFIEKKNERDTLAT